MRVAFLTIVFCVPVSAATTEVAAPGGPWWLPHAITLIGIFIGAMLIVYQLGKQHANESERQNENFKGQLKLQIYQEFSHRLTSASSAAHAAGAQASQVIGNLSSFAWRTENGMSPKPIADRAEDLIEKQHAAAAEATEVMFLVEKYNIVHPDLDIFKSAIGSAGHDLGQAFQAFFDRLVDYLPVDYQSTGGNTILSRKMPGKEDLEALKKLASACQEAAMELNCYLMDMRAELQTLLLGHLFPNTMVPRRPLDPSMKVITLDPANIKALHEHFRNNTEWGRQWVEAQKRVEREFHDGREPL